MDKNELLKIIEKAAREKTIYLSLSNRDITKLPAEIGKLTDLTRLDLSSNKLTTVPHQLGLLANLTQLYLHQNQMTSIPSELGKLKKLTGFYLHENQLTSIPAELGKLTNLKVLSLANNQLTSIPPELGKLTKLETLILDDNETLISPPPEVVKQGTKAILAYLREQLKESTTSSRQSVPGRNKGKGKGGTVNATIDPKEIVTEFEKRLGCKLGRNSRRIVQEAWKLAKGANPKSPRFTTGWLLLAIVVCGKRARTRNTAKFLYERVKEKEREVRESYRAVVSKTDSVSQFNTEYVSGTMEKATQIAIETTGNRTISLRHLFAGLLLYKPERREGAPERLREMGVDIDELRAQFLAFLKEAQLKDDIAAWTRILKDQAAPEEMEDEGASQVVAFLPSHVRDQASSEDLLGFEPYVKAVADFLKHPETKPPLTLSIEGEWGCGKSSFMLQLQEKLSEEDAHVVEFSPWRHDKEDAVWAAFVLAFIDQLSTKMGGYRATMANLKLLRSRFDWKAGWPEIVKIGIQLLAFVLVLVCVLFVLWRSSNPYFGDFAPVSKIFWSVVSVLVSGGAVLLKALKKVKDVVGNPFEHDLMKYVKAPDYAGRMPFVERFHRDFNKVVEAYADGKKVYVFIDDLDRCEVPKAADLMQAINLMITKDPGLVFIVGMDREKVAAGLAVKFRELVPFLFRPEDGGEKLAQAARVRLRGIEYGYNFIEKFIQIPFLIPRPDEQNLKGLLDRIGTRTVVVKPYAAAKPATIEEPMTQEPKAEEEADSGYEPEDSGRPEKIVDIEKVEQKAKRAEARVAFDRDFDRMREIVFNVNPALESNPRRVKQFVNLFRLRAYIAIETGLIDLYKRAPSLKDWTFEKLGKLVAIRLRWPLLLAESDRDPTMLRQLEQAAWGLPGSKSLEHEVSPFARWAGRQDLAELLRAGCFDDNGKADPEGRKVYSIGELDLDKLLLVSPRVRTLADQVYATEEQMPEEGTAKRERDVREQADAEQDKSGREPLKKTVKKKTKKKARKKKAPKKKAKRKTVKKKTKKQAGKKEVSQKMPKKKMANEEKAAKEKKAADNELSPEEKRKAELDGILAETEVEEKSDGEIADLIDKTPDMALRDDWVENHARLAPYITETGKIRGGIKPSMIKKAKKLLRHYGFKVEE